jgi:hypothetical protein
MIEGVSQLQDAKIRSPIPGNLDAKQLILQVRLTGWPSRSVQAATTASVGHKLCSSPRDGGRSLSEVDFLTRLDQLPIAFHKQVQVFPPLWDINFRPIEADIIDRDAIYLVHITAASIRALMTR